MVGPIEILPPLRPSAAGPARSAPLDPIAATPGATSRRRDAAPRPAPAEVIIDLDASGEPRRGSDSASAEKGAHARGRRRALPPYAASEGRRSPFTGAPADAAGRPAARDAGTLAYRSADSLIADYAHRGTFFDLSV